MLKLSEIDKYNARESMCSEWGLRDNNTIVYIQLGNGQLHCDEKNQVELWKNCVRVGWW